MSKQWKDMTDKEYVAMVEAAMRGSLAKFKSTPEARERAGKVFGELNERYILENTKPPTRTKH